MLASHCFEFGRWALGPTDARDGQRVVKRRGLIAQHDIVGSRHAHDEVTPPPPSSVSDVHVVLVGLGMVGVADVHPIGSPISLPQKPSSMPARIISLPS